ncbi:MAG TPA: hypothetical protein VMV07_21840 [Streptosporangiaceae bacterium]|nr:hypothetical protein [Streptosporangiaceae bacterium]
MRSTTSARAASVLVIVLGLLLARALTAQAASTSGWPLTVAMHYGAADHASGYSAVVAPGRTDVWALGGTNPGGGSAPAALHWNGVRWQSWPLPPRLTGFIGDASAPSARDIWAVSYSAGYALHWNGERWSVAKRWHQHDVLTGVTALSPADVWVFGTSTDGVRGMGTWHFDGRTWARAQGRAKQIYRASAVSARDIWAVAATRRGGFVEHYDGHAWRYVATGRMLVRASLDDVLAVSRHNVWVVGNVRAPGSEGRLVIAHFDGRNWTRTLTPWHADTGRLAPDGYGGAWITADASGVRAEAFIARVSARGKLLAWSTLRQGTGSGVSDIAAGRHTKAVWLSGGFLTKAGGDAAIWSHGGHGRSRATRAVHKVRPEGPLVVRSWRLDLAALLWPSHPPAIT